MATAARKTDAPKNDKPQDAKGIGVKDLAAHLGTDARSLRGFLRRTDRAVGRGERYSWASLTDPAVKKLAADWKAAQASDEAASDEGK